MSKQPENKNQQPHELRQALLNELEAGQQAITELSDEELEAVAGGSFWKDFGRGFEKGFTTTLSLGTLFIK